MERIRLLVTRFLIPSIFVLTTGATIPMLGQTVPSNAIYRLEWSADGQYIAAGLWNGEVQIWQAGPNRAKVATLVADTRGLYSIAWQQRANVLATIGEGQIVRIWHIPESQIIHEIRLRETRHALGHYMQLFWLAEDEELITTASEVPPYLVIWDVDNQSIISQYAFGGNGVVVSPSREYIATAEYAAFGIIGTDTWVRHATIRIPDVKDPLGQISSLSWNVDSSLLATASYDGMVYIWDAETGRLIKSFLAETNIQSLPKRMGIISHLRFDPTGTKLQVGNVNGIVRLWDIQGKPTLVETFQSRELMHYAVYAWSPYGAQLAVGSESGVAPGFAVDVPFASRERFDAIANRCISSSDSRRLLETASTSSLIERIRSLPTSDIPPACAADLLAISEALSQR